MTWPDTRCPPTNGPTAEEHLEAIRERARAEKAAGRADIEAAVEACLKSACLFGDPPQRGRAPDRHDHGAAVLWARICADDGNWGECLSALKHGKTPPSRRKKKAKQDRGNG